jgi:hypothetical protein
MFGSVVFAFFGVNPSTADAVDNDPTVRKWIGFSDRNDARRFIVGNVFALRSTDVRALALHVDPVGPDSDLHLTSIIREADILVPCWGNRSKLPKTIHYRLDDVVRMIFAAGKPVRIWGTTKSGDPLHPLMLSYHTPLVEWRP